MKKNLLFLISIFLISFNGYTQSWSALGNGFNGDVNALCVYNGSLYAAGNFTQDGTGSTNLSHVARWTGTAWVAVGTGISGNVLALTVWNGDLYAGGLFSSPGTNICKWNGSSWSAIGSGLNGEVRCLLDFNNELYAGGIFTGKIVKLSGTTFNTVGGGAAGAVNAITNYNGNLIIGGLWSSPNVSKLTSGVWAPLSGTGPDGEVTSLAVFQKFTNTNYVLWIGGKFTNPSPRLCTWAISGGGFANSFNPFNNTAGANVNTLLPTFSFLYAGGGFDALVNGTLPLSRIGKYNWASSWDTVVSSPNNDINAFAIYNTHLIAGGKFTTFGVAANRVAIRNTNVGIDEQEENIVVKDFFPNPVVEEALLKFQTRTSLDQPVIKVFDMLGKELSDVAGLVSLNKYNREAEFRISRAGLSPGVYFYEVSDQKKSITTGKFIVE